MKKLFLVLVLCLSVIGLSGCGSSAPKELEIGPNTTKILEVGKDIAPGNYVVETDKEKIPVGGGDVYYYNRYTILANNDGNINVIKQDEAKAPNTWFIGKRTDGPDIKNEKFNNGSTFSLEKGQTLVVYSVGNTTLKQQ